MVSLKLLIALTLWYETRGEMSYEARQAVASVIYNRADSRRPVQSFEDVILEPEQFSCWNERPHENLKAPGGYETNQRWLQCLKISQQMLMERFVPSGTWTHYYNPDKCSPSWGDALVDVHIIENHLFGREVGY